jgi:hypothetical protein
MLLVRQTGCWSDRRATGLIDRFLIRQTDCFSNKKSFFLVRLLVGEIGFLPAAIQAVDQAGRLLAKQEECWSDRQAVDQTGRLLVREVGYWPG